MLKKVKKKKRSKALVTGLDERFYAVVRFLSGAMKKKKPAEAFMAMNCDYQEDNSKEDKNGRVVRIKHVLLMKHSCRASARIQRSQPDSQQELHCNYLGQLLPL